MKMLGLIEIVFGGGLFSWLLSICLKINNVTLWFLFGILFSFYLFLLGWSYSLSKVMKD